MSGPPDPWTATAFGLLFDSDGVLVDSDASVTRSWTRWSQHHELDPAAVLAVVHGRRAVDTVNELLPERLHAGALERLHGYEIEDAAGVAALPGAVQLTAGLPDGAWAVVTSATAALAAARLAAQRLGVPVRECVVLEDAASGVAAARAAGVGCVIGIGERALDTDADVVVPDLRAVSFDTAAGTVRINGSRLR